MDHISPSGGFVEIFSQGLIGIPDLFIHPSYISGAGYESAVVWGAVFVIISIIILQVLYHFLFRRKDHKKEREWDYSEFYRPPP